MSVNFPTALDNFEDPISGTALGSVTKHTIHHKNINDALEAIEVKIGINNSEDENSLDYRLKNKRVLTFLDQAISVIDTDSCDIYELSAIANNTEFTLTGTPKDGQTLMIRLKDAGISKNLTWTGFIEIGAMLPTSTTAGKWHYIGCVYNLSASAWHAIAVGEEA